MPAPHWSAPAAIAIATARLLAWRIAGTRFLAITLVAGAASPACAQVALEAALQTDYRVRGYSVSDGEPAASLSASYDDASGAYLGASVIGTVRDGEPALLGIQASAGYAVRLTPTVSIDGGVTKTQYFQGYGTGRDYDYTEVYVGVALPVVSARLSYSPDYYFNGTQTLYAEVDAGFEPAPDWFLSAHAGVLTYLDTPPPYMPRRSHDWRVGASRQLGAFGVHLDLSGRIQGRARYWWPGGPGAGRDPVDLVLTLTRAF
jgi:uncharacterized protein (TIGR02001 family)